MPELRNVKMGLLPGCPVKDWKRVCFRVEHIFVERYQVLLMEQKVEIF
jgi:hypothetical protein